MSIAQSLQRIEGRLGAIDGRLQGFAEVTGRQTDVLGRQVDQIEALRIDFREESRAHRDELARHREQSEMLTQAVLRTLERLDRLEGPPDD